MLFRSQIDNPLQVTIPNGKLFNMGTLSTLPNGVTLDRVNGTIYGKVPYQIDSEAIYNFTIKAYHIANDASVTESSKEFSITILGATDNEINWISDSYLGSIIPNQPSSLTVIAKSKNNNSILNYFITEGELPPGLSLSTDGEVTGKIVLRNSYSYRSLWNASRIYKINDSVKYKDYYYIRTTNQISTESEFIITNWQYYNPTINKNILSFSDVSVTSQTFDNNTTTFDRTYNLDRKSTRLNSSH